MGAYSPLVFFSSFHSSFDSLLPFFLLDQLGIGSAYVIFCLAGPRVPNPPFTLLYNARRSLKSEHITIYKVATNCCSDIPELSLTQIRLGLPFRPVPVPEPGGLSGNLYKSTVDLDLDNNMVRLRLRVYILSILSTIW